MNIVLTGASKGIGYESAKEFARRKIDKLVLISRDTKKLKKLRAECLSINANLEIYLLTEDIVELTSSKAHILSALPLKSIDVLINNAGVLINKSFEDFSDNDLKQMTEVNYLAPARLIRLLLPKLIKETPSHVVNISSMGGFQGSSKFPGLSMYSSSKAALASLSECLAAEFAQTNVRFNCLALGAVKTEMLEKAFPGYKAPLNAKEMGSHIADFALNGYKYFNGKILPVSVSNP